MLKSINIRKCSILDLEKLKELELVCFQDHFHENFNFVLKSKNYSYFLAEEVGRIVGYAGASILYDESELQYIATLPSLRRNGIAKALMAVLVEDLIKKGVNKMYLEVKEDNAPAISLYKKLGFIIYNVRKKYYGDKDAIVMVKLLK